jgi:hypothetical protein
MEARQQALVAKTLCGLVALVALVGGMFDRTVGLLGLWVAVPALAGMGWRTPIAYLSATGLGVVLLLIALLMQGDPHLQVMTAACLGALAVSGYFSFYYQ